MATLDPVSHEEADKVAFKIMGELIAAYPALRICDLRWIIERTQHEILKKTHEINKKMEVKL